MLRGIPPRTRSLVLPCLAAGKPATRRWATWQMAREGLSVTLPMEDAAAAAAPVRRRPTVAYPLTKVTTLAPRACMHLTLMISQS